MASINTIKSIVRTFINHDEAKNKSVIIWGPPGIGKTDLFAQLAAEVNAKLKVFLTSTMDPTDVVGVPHPIDGVTHFLPPLDFHALTEDAEYTGPLVCCFDDIPAGNESVFNALLRFFHNREVAGKKIRDNVFICATGNRAEDRANARDLGTALNNRFIHFNMEVSNEEWREWAIKNDVEKEIIGYIGARPNMLHDFKPEENIREFPTPRSVVTASVVQKALGVDHPQLHAALSGCCGEAWSTEYKVYLANAEFAVNPEDIVKNPSGCKVPKESEVDVTHATISSLSYYLHKHSTTSNIKAGLHYASRLHQAEFGIVLARDIMRSIVAELKDLDVRVEVCDSDEFNKIDKQFGKYING